jgi:lipopolysaccharide export system protein LptA
VNRLSLLATLLGGVALGGMALAGGARAQGLDLSKGGPVEVTSTNGMEWRQGEQTIIATGDARAVRDGVTVLADRLLARYRRKAGTAAPAAAAPPTGTAPAAGGADTGNNEIYRLEAEGNVRIFTATDQAVGDRAVYDIDQAVLVLTGKALRLTTPQQVLTARDSMEYWSAKHMAVGRGAATVTTNDGRRITGDTLVGFTEAGDTPVAAGAKPAATPVSAVPGKPGADSLGGGSGKLKRVEGFGNVEVRTAVETIRGDRGVYVADTGIARLQGHVHITRGQSQLNGDEAIINMRTGVSTLTRNPGSRVQGLVVPNDGSVPRGAPGGDEKSGAKTGGQAR